MIHYFQYYYGNNVCVCLIIFVWVHGFNSFCSLHCLSFSLHTLYIYMLLITKNNKNWSHIVDQIHTSIKIITAHKNLQDTSVCVYKCVQSKHSVSDINYQNESECTQKSINMMLLLYLYSLLLQKIWRKIMPAEIFLNSSLQQMITKPKMYIFYTFFENSAYINVYNNTNLD